MQKNGSGRRLTMNVDQAAEMLGIGRNAAYEAVRRGEIPCVRIGGRILVPRAALQKMLGLDSQNETSTQPR